MLFPQSAEAFLPHGKSYITPLFGATVAIQCCATLVQSFVIFSGLKITLIAVGQQLNVFVPGLNIIIS